MVDMNKNRVGVIDIFCGVGGLTHGLQQAGLKVIAGIDSDLTCKYAYERNNGAKFVYADIRELKPKNILDLFDGNNVRILAGCAPCQPFSTHTQKYKPDNKDYRWHLLNYFKDIVLLISPDIVTIENVPRLSKESIFLEFVAALDEHGYKVLWNNVRCAQYGVPQSRSRLVLLASKLGGITLIPPTHERNQYVSVRDVIADLPPLKAGEVDKNDPLHRAAGLTELNLKRIRQSAPGGSWRDWDKELRLKCHKRKTGRSYGSIYGRMRWSQLASTITTQFYNIGTGRFGHPEQDRGLSLREGALLQTFPQYYQFYDPEKPLPLGVVARHIGNAVPVRLGYIIGKSIVEHLSGVYDSNNTSVR
jgi:DNA (cytosine-5)-methyltransferase 1